MRNDNLSLCFSLARSFGIRRGTVISNLSVYISRAVNAFRQIAGSFIQVSPRPLVKAVYLWQKSLSTRPFIFAKNHTTAAVRCTNPPFKCWDLFQFIPIGQMCHESIPYTVHLQCTISCHLESAAPAAAPQKGPSSHQRDNTQRLLTLIRTIEIFLLFCASLNILIKKAILGSACANI